MKNKGLKVSEPSPEDGRESLRKRVYIGCAVLTEKSCVQGRIIDLSVGGAFIQCKEELRSGMEITLSFILPGRETSTDVSLQASIVHMGRFIQGFENFAGFGIRFTSLSTENKLRLEDFLSSADGRLEQKYVLY